MSDATRAAVKWHERLKRQPTSTDLADFEAWRISDPLNAQAYADVTQGLVWAQSLKDTPEMLALRQETLERLMRKPAKRTWRYAVAAGVAAILVVSGSWWAGQFLDLFGRLPVTSTASEIDTRVYQTRLGEQMNVTLADGSIMQLNTQSTVQVRYAQAERRLTLVEGQALFTVAKAPERPFVVQAGERTVTAVGTEFDVRLDGPSLQVALIEGDVIVKDQRLPADAGHRLKPNDVLSAVGSRATVTHHPDLRRFVSWKDGIVLFDNTPMSQALAELNRYGPKTVIAGDDRVAAIRLSGSFPVGRTESFLEAVQVLFPVRIVSETAEQIVLAYNG